MVNGRFRVRKPGCSRQRARAESQFPRGRCTTLVLTRREMERIFLDLPDGRSIVITVIEIDRGKVRLGIDAPEEIVISREEVRRRPGQPGGVLPIPRDEAPRDT